MTDKIYPIGTLQEIAKIPDEALPRFLWELPEILKAVRQSVEMVEGLSKITGIEIQSDVPKWIDDDLGQSHITFKKPDGEMLFRVTENMVKP